MATATLSPQDRTPALSAMAAEELDLLHCGGAGWWAQEPRLTP